VVFLRVTYYWADFQCWKLWNKGTNCDVFDVLIVKHYSDQVHIYIPFTLFPRSGSRDISDIPPRHPHFTNMIQLWEILQTWQMASASPSDRSPSQMLVMLILYQVLFVIVCRIYSYLEKTPAYFSVSLIQLPRTQNVQKEENRCPNINFSCFSLPHSK
jgi:hypothetical protein